MPLLPLAVIGTTLGAHAQSTTDEVAAITRHFEKYTSLMDAVDTDAISTDVYATPVFFAGPDGKHSVIATPEQLSKAWRSLLVYREKRPDLPKAVSKVRSICFLRQDVAMASVHFEFPKADGSSGASEWLYLLQKSKGEWRMTMLTEEAGAVSLTCGAPAN